MRASELKIDDLPDGEKVSDLQEREQSRNRF